MPNVRATHELTSLRQAQTRTLNFREPVHVHISVKRPERHATKIWITKSGGTLIANNNSKIPQQTLVELCTIIEARRFEIMEKGQDTFGELKFYC